MVVTCISLAELQIFRILDYGHFTGAKDVVYNLDTALFTTPGAYYKAAFWRFVVNPLILKNIGVIYESLSEVYATSGSCT